MLSDYIKRLLPPTVLLSLLLHLGLLLSLSTVLFFSETVSKKKPHEYVPAYVYQQNNAVAYVRDAAKQQVPQSQVKPEKSVKLKQHKVASVRKAVAIPQKSVLSLTYDMLKHNQQRMIASLSAKQEPIYLIGDHNNPADPLVRLLSRSLSINFKYPEQAGLLGIKGKVVIGLQLHPSGHLSHVQLLRSSDNADLDAAALYAANQAPPVIGADKFLSRPKHFVVGFIFR